ncbi:MAG: FtsQ-type POTRA domain-containing protein [Clostridia bacterium]|nr:FtsQ-type POTRA domain-containing protein [Clostridia bacterium]
MKKQTDKRTETHVSQNEREKSAAKNRKTKKKQKEAIISVIVIIVLLATILVAGAALLKVGNIEVVGNDGRYTDDRIVEIAGISADSSILLLNEEKISAAVSLALPYIQSVSISRRLPDYVQVEVTYAQAAFAVDCGQLWLILSEDGKVLETTQIEPYNMTQLQGILVDGYTVGKAAEFADKLYFEHATDVYAACLENGIEDVRSLKTDPSGYVSMNVEDRFFVNSPSVHVLLNEMAVLKKVMAERAEKTTAFTFTLAADGSITISNRESDPEEENTTMFMDPYLNLDSELVGSDDTENKTGELTGNQPTQENVPATSDAGALG